MSPRHALKTGSSLVAAASALYLVMAYVLLPAGWSIGERLDDRPKRPMMTYTPQGIPGDPINIGLVADQAALMQAFHMADWYPADPVTLRTSVTIGASVLLDRPDLTAPVSSLYYDGRRQDLAFEKQAGESADRRHHLRLWLMDEADADGRPLWLGAASFDSGIGLSRDTGQITHRIAADLDAERARVMEDLKAAGVVTSTYEVDGIGPTENGRNGGGDRYMTDGKAVIAVIGD